MSPGNHMTTIWVDCVPSLTGVNQAAVSGTRAVACTSNTTSVKYDNMTRLVKSPWALRMPVSLRRSSSGMGRSYLGNSCSIISSICRLKRFVRMAKKQMARKKAHMMKYVSDSSAFLLSAISTKVMVIIPVMTITDIWMVRKTVSVKESLSVVLSKNTLHRMQNIWNGVRVTAGGLVAAYSVWLSTIISDVYLPAYGHRKHLPGNIKEPGLVGWVRSTDATAVSCPVVYFVANDLIAFARVRSPNVAVFSRVYKYLNRFETLVLQTKRITFFLTPKRSVELLFGAVVWCLISQLFSPERGR